VKDFVIPELPAYRPFYPLTHNSASGQKTARSETVALKPRLMHQHHDLFASIRFRAGHSTIYLDAQAVVVGGAAPFGGGGGGGGASAAAKTSGLGYDRKIPAEALKKARRGVALSAQVIVGTWVLRESQLSLHTVGGRVGIVDSAREKNKAHAVAERSEFI